MRARLGLFAYGSLVSPESASATLDRSFPAPRPARLRGWRRRWSQVRDNLAVEKTFARRDDGTTPPHVLGLNIEPWETDVEGPNGGLVELSEEELLRLDLREMRYDRVEVTAAVGAPAGFDRVYAYRAKRAQFAPRPPPGTVVIAAYVARVEAAFAALGKQQLELYRATTDPPPVEVVEAELVRDRIPPGNPREW
jgi:Gamma-glutamyl cyclotransferase, AIG2-like